MFLAQEKCILTLLSLAPIKKLPTPLSKFAKQFSKECLLRRHSILIFSSSLCLTCMQKSIISYERLILNLSLLVSCAEQIATKQAKILFIAQTDTSFLGKLHLVLISLNSMASLCV